MGAAPLTATVGHDPGSEDPRQLRQFLREMAAALNGTTFVRLLDPNGDGTYYFNLTANAATTVLTDSTKRLWGYASAVIFVPLTANAAAEQGSATGTPYVTQANLLPGTMTITHANNSQTDRTFRLVIIG